MKHLGPCRCLNPVLNIICALFSNSGYRKSSALKISYFFVVVELSRCRLEGFNLPFSSLPFISAYFTTLEDILQPEPCAQDVLTTESVPTSFTKTVIRLG